MSQTAKTAREAMKSKAKRLAAGDPHTKVDSSTWSPPEALDADVKTGARPLVKRLYKKGGKVSAPMEGKKADHRGDRKPRKSGGRIGKEADDRSKRYLTPDNLINRDVRMANEAREGKKHVGAFKKGGKAFPDLTGDGKVTKADVLKGRGVFKHGGKAHKFGGGDVVGDNPVSVQNRSMGKAAGVMKKGGRAKYEKGGTPMDMGSMDDLTPYQREMVLKGRDPFEDERPSTMVIKKTTAVVPAKGDKVPLPPRRPADLMKKGGKVKNWEGSKKDEAQDRMLAKKYGISMEKWEKSKLDEKHDKQQSTEGLKKGGRTAKYSGGGVFSGSSYPGKIPGAVGGRHAHAKGGKAKGKTNINIVIATGKGPQGADMGMPNAPVPAPRGMPVPPPMAPQGIPVPPVGGPPPGMPPMPPQGGAPMPPMGRKSGGRTIHVINHAAGGGLGRLEKVKAYGHKAGKVVGKQ